MRVYFAYSIAITWHSLCSVQSRDFTASVVGAARSVYLQASEIREPYALVSMNVHWSFCFCIELRAYETSVDGLHSATCETMFQGSFMFGQDRQGLHEVSKASLCRAELSKVLMRGL